ncbi:glycosyltransferase family 32 protein [Trichoderma chlorosporum]
MLSFAGWLRHRRLALVLLSCVIIWQLSTYRGYGSNLYNLAKCRTIIKNYQIPSSAITDCPASRKSNKWTSSSHSGLATALSPAELLCRSIEPRGAGIPKLLHQSWKSSDLPAKFKRWSDTCRKHHPDWEWVLWTDEDNFELVKDYFPWLEDTFLNLPGNIYKADLARNLYMYMFGGIYADLYTECLRPTLDALKLHNISLFGNSETKSEISTSHVAMFGRMGADQSFEHHLPNAWMAASAQHPFFLLPLEFARAEIQKSKRIFHQLWYEYPSAEQLTGPIALAKNIRHYQTCGDTLEKVICLPDGLIYPYNWNDDRGLRSICSAETDSFNETQCKETLSVDTKGSISITYWSHTHKGKGQDDANINRMGHEK